MGQYVFRRLLGIIPMLFGITLVNFLILISIPGGPLSAYRNSPNVRAEDLARLEERLGLNQPPIVRYGIWLNGFIQGNWGYSYVTQRAVTTMVWERLNNTLFLVGVSLLLTLLLAIPLATYSAMRQYSLFDHATTTLAFVGYSIPTFWLGLLLILLFSVQLRWLPAGGMTTLGVELSGWDALVDKLRFLTLPVFTLSVASTGFFTRYLRASMLDVINLDYVRTAWSKGLKERTVLYQHALKNAMIPFVTVVGLHLPQVFTGTVVAETIFAWPGIGRLFFRSAMRFDYPVLMAIMTISALLVLLFNLLADIIYGLLDPRIRYE